MNLLFKTFNFLVGFTISIFVMQVGINLVPQTAEEKFIIEAVLLPASSETQWIEVCQSSSEVTMVELQGYRSTTPRTNCRSVETVVMGRNVSNVSFSDIPRISALQEI